MAIGRNWDDVKNGLTSLSQDEKDEIDFQVKLVGEILSARKEKGMTQAELDALCGINQTHIARIENNKADPQLSTIFKILRPLGKTLAVVDVPPAVSTPTGAQEVR
ncbi:helix-turn-helix domain protein [Syntrophobotulus glycolicus DSM 8271]|uniref:Helix-turn-helix domain protein n=1 Tax=Syntrophobotulus glycolicus (strain DSM 8271 / FlGlyR) TaxID=645991 RepID=F0SX79_SYNGF|nr:helix-turn-helix transcriptional regulator [Syntrophobotulus glycolicus]ADY56939.1 helix-turn-helix domain protein [Syntrophobotulus glycolicus DSM 8271]